MAEHELQIVRSGRFGRSTVCGPPGVLGGWMTMGSRLRSICRYHVACRRDRPRLPTWAGTPFTDLRVAMLPASTNLLLANVARHAIAMRHDIWLRAASVAGARAVRPSLLRRSLSGARPSAALRPSAPFAICLRRDSGELRAESRRLAASFSALASSTPRRRLHGSVSMPGFRLARCSTSMPISGAASSVAKNAKYYQHHTVSWCAIASFLSIFGRVRLTRKARGRSVRRPFD